MLPLLLATTDSVAQGLQDRPFPYFLAILLGAITGLWGTLSTVAWWGVRGQLRLAAENYRRELERNADLRKERDEAQERLEREQAARLGLAVEIATTAKGLARIREDLDAEALKKRGGKPLHPPGGP
jgi:hypothetical protein